MSELNSLESRKPRSSRRQPQTQQPDPFKCPRCESTNTKFCYYNNYNKTQPRYFCKVCKRHWTNGGTLRSVPIGGGRKNKRLGQSNITATATMIIRSNPSMDQDSLLPGLSYPKESSFDDSRSSFFKPIGSERKDDVESYTDIEELKGLVSWDFYGSFIGHEDLSISFETKPSSNIPRSSIEELENGVNSTITTTSNLLELNSCYWNDLDTMFLEDLNKPWEDPTFKT